jgi:hypothetical protein
MTVKTTTTSTGSRPLAEELVELAALSREETSIPPSDGRSVPRNESWGATGRVLCSRATAVTGSGLGRRSSAGMAILTCTSSGDMLKPSAVSLTTVNMSELDGSNPVFNKGEEDLESTRDKHNIIFQELRETFFPALERYRAKRLVLVKEREKKLNDIALQDPEVGRRLSSDPWYHIPLAHDVSLSQDGTMIHWFPDPTGLAQPLTYSRQLSQYFLHESQVSASDFVTCIHLMT